MAIGRIKGPFIIRKYMGVSPGHHKVTVKADSHGTILSHAICLRQVYNMKRFV